jgi:hypothetical protein
MTISVTALSWLVGMATVIAAVATVVLMVLWMKDFLGGRLW